MELNEDFSFSSNGDVIARYQLSNGILQIQKGFGNLRGEMIKKLASLDVEVSKHEILDELDQAAPVVLPAALKAPEASKPVEAAKALNTVAVKKKDNPNPDGESEAAGLYERCQGLEKQLKTLTEENDRLKAALNSARKVNPVPAIPVSETHLDPGQHPIYGGSVLSPARQKLADYGPRGAKSMGDKDPIVIAWAKENLTADEFEEVYGNRLGGSE